MHGSIIDSKHATKGTSMARSERTTTTGTKIMAVDDGFASSPIEDLAARLRLNPDIYPVLLGYRPEGVSQF